jgi:hypothetical protein
VKAAEEFKGAHYRFLHNVLGIRVISRQPPRKVVRGIQMRQDGSFKIGGLGLFLQAPSLFLLSSALCKDRDSGHFIPKKRILHYREFFLVHGSLSVQRRTMHF